MKEGIAASLIVPTLNEENYIEKTLISLKNQEFDEEYEIIVSDGLSTDKTLEIARKYVDKIVFEPKRTIGAGRNKGASVAEGKVLIFCSADTYYPRNWLKHITYPILKKKFGIAYGPLFPLDGNIVETLFSSTFLLPYTYLSSLLKIYYVGGENLAVERKLFRVLGGFNENMTTSEDTDLVRRASKISRVKFEPKAKVYVSMRRVRKWGYVKYLKFHTSNYLNYHFFKRVYAKYEPIR